MAIVDEARVAWLAREPGPRLGVLAKAAWQEWSAEGDANGWTGPRTTVVKTGDGHGHHVPGTPNEYSHGWQPLHDSDNGGGAAHPLHEFFRGRGQFIHEESPYPGVHVSLTGVGDIVLSANKHGFVPGRPASDREEVTTVDADGARAISQLIEKTIRDSYIEEEEEESEETPVEREMRLVDYDFPVEDKDAPVIGFNPDGQTLIGWPKNGEGPEEFDSDRFEDDYDVWLLDDDDAYALADSLRETADLSEEEPEYIDGHSIGEYQELSLFSDMTFGFGEGGQDGTALAVNHTSGLEAIGEALAKVRDGEAGADHQDLFQTYDVDVDGDEITVSHRRGGGSFTFDRPNLGDAIDAVAYMLKEVAEGQTRFIESAINPTAAKSAVPDLVKVGPKGYIHGWIYVGPPKVGALVHHPEHGSGKVTRHSKKTLGVQFDSGSYHAFEHAAETPDPGEHFTARPSRRAPKPGTGTKAPKTPVQRRAAALDRGAAWSGNPYLRLSSVEALTPRDWKAFTDDERTRIVDAVKRLRDRAAKNGNEPEVFQRAQALLDRFNPAPKPKNDTRHAIEEFGKRVEREQQEREAAALDTPAGREKRIAVTAKTIENLKRNGIPEDNPGVQALRQRIKEDQNWIDAHAAGGDRVPAEHLQQGDYARVTGTDQYGAPTTLAGYVIAPAGSYRRGRGRKQTTVTGVYMAENPSGANGWRGQVFVEPGTHVERLPDPGNPERGTALPDPEHEARIRQAEIDQKRALADTLAEVHERIGGEDGPDVLRRSITTSAARHGLDTTTRDQLLAATVPTGGLAPEAQRRQVHAALTAVADRMETEAGLTRIGRPGGVVAFDQRLHEPMPGSRLRVGQTAQVVRPGHHARVGNGEQVRLSRAVVEAHETPATGRGVNGPVGGPSNMQVRNPAVPFDDHQYRYRLEQAGQTFPHDSVARWSLERWSRQLAAGRVTRGQAAEGIRADADRMKAGPEATNLRGVAAELTTDVHAPRDVDQFRAQNEAIAAGSAPKPAAVAASPAKRNRAAAARQLLDSVREAPAEHRREILRGSGVDDLREAIRQHGVAGLLPGGRAALPRTKKPELIQHLLDYIG